MAKPRYERLLGNLAEKLSAGITSILAKRLKSASVENSAAMLSAITTVLGAHFETSVGAETHNL